MSEIPITFPDAASEELLAGADWSGRAINPIVVNFYSLIVVYDVKLSNIRRLPGPGVSIVPQLQC